MATRKTNTKGKAKGNAGVIKKLPTNTYPRFSAYPNLSVSGSQFLNGRPVIRHAGSHSLTDVVELADRLKRRVQEQMDKLFATVLDWVTSQNSKIAGFGGGWRVQEYSVANDLPAIRAMFVIVQANQDTADESLWLDIARLDVQISQLPEFSNVRVNFTPLPFMEHEKIIAYLQLKFSR